MPNMWCEKCWDNRWFEDKTEELSNSETFVCSDCKSTKKYKRTGEHMNKNIVLGLLSGKKQAGKTWGANKIKRDLESKGYSVMIISFAKPLKEDCELQSKRLFGKKIADLNADEKEKLRPVMQKYGMVAREIDENFWVNVAKKTIEDNSDKYSFFLIDDVRFENEIESFEHLKTIKIRITRDNGVTEEDNDPSETGLDYYKGFDFVVESVNNEVVEEFDKYINERVKYDR